MQPFSAGQDALPLWSQESQIGHYETVESKGDYPNYIKLLIHDSIYFFDRLGSNVWL